MFVAVSIYFFFKAEELQRELIVVKREISSTKKDNKAYVELMAIIAQRHEEIAKQRFVELRTVLHEESEMFEIIAPMINSYATIFNDSVRTKGKLKSSVEKVYEGSQKGSYKLFSNFIAQSDKDIKRAWSSNNINGFIILVEALLKFKKQ